MTAQSLDLERLSAPEVFRRRAMATPDRIALEDSDGRSLSFAELHTGALHWAGALQRAGIGPGDRVASMFPNSLEMLQLWLGLGWAHAWDVSVNTAYRGEILKHVLSNAAPRLIFLEAPYVEAFLTVAAELPSIETVVVWGDKLPTGLSVTVLTLEDFLSDAAPVVDTDPPLFSDIQGIVYTSGTTGVSKGARIAWGRHSGGAASQMFKLIFNEDDVWLSDFPACHNSAKMPLRITGQIGCKSVIAPMFKTDRFWHDVRRFGVTATLLLPNMMHWLVGAPASDEDASHPLRQVIGYGPDLGPFGRRFGIKVHCNYGNTEAGNTLFHLDVGDAASGYSGKATWPFEAKIVDDEDFEVPLGETGQLVTRCNQPWMMFQGYNDMPEATEATLRNGWYHTGDLFRMDERGGVWFVDRHADYIRRRGENISSFEVEKVVLEHPAVHEAAAIGVQSLEGEDEVKICIALGSGQTVDPVELLAFLTPRLATFMIPRFIEILPELPKTPATHRVRKNELRVDPLNANTWDAGPSRKTHTPIIANT